MNMAAIERLYRRAQMMIGIGQNSLVSDSGPLQMMQAELGPTEVRNNLPVYGLFGLASSPPVGSSILAVFLGGIRSSGAIIGINSGKYRPRNLGAGETAIYDMLGQKVYLSTTGIQILGNGELPLTISGFNDINITGNVTVSGDVSVSGDVVASNISLVNHKTAGVEPGTGESGKPIAS